MPPNDDIIMTIGKSSFICTYMFTELLQVVSDGVAHLSIKAVGNEVGVSPS